MDAITQELIQKAKDAGYRFTYLSGNQICVTNGILFHIVECNSMMNHYRKLLNLIGF